jgi:Protein of unknown function (DUF2800)
VRVTASSAALLHACAYSFRDDVECPTEAPKAYRDRGVVFGLLAEQWVNGGPTPEISEAIAAMGDEEGRKLTAMWAHARAWLEANCRPGWVAERAFAYSPADDVGRELPRLSHRDYSDAGPGEVCGTADLVWLDGDTICVGDWKSTSDGAPDVDAREQLEWLALFAARAYGLDSARIVTLRVTAGGVTAIEGEALDMFGLAAVAERIAANVARIPGAEAIQGDHCNGRYCKAILVCPETTALVGQVIEASALVHKSWMFAPVIESPDHLQWLLTMKPIAEKYLDSIGAAIVAYVKPGPVTASDGATIEQRWRTMPRTDQGELVALARAKGAAEEEIQACTHGRLEPNGVRASKAAKPRKGKAV